MAARGIEQHHGAVDVGVQERLGIVDAAIDVGLGGEVDHRGHVAHDGIDHHAVGDVAAHEAVARMRGNVGKVLQIAGIRQGVEVDDVILRMMLQDVADEVRADEAGAAGDQDLHD